MAHSFSTNDANSNMDDSRTDENPFDHDHLELVMNSSERAVDRAAGDTVPESKEEDDSDSSMNEYMANWLNRYNISSSVVGDNPDATNKGSSNGTDSTDQTDPPYAGNANPEAAAAEPKENKRAKKEYVHELPPESTDDINAMRNLARASTQMALQTHCVRTTVGALQRVIVIGLMSVICSITLLRFSSSADSWNYTLSVVAMLVAVISFVRYVVLARRLTFSTNVTQ